MDQDRLDQLFKDSLFDHKTQIDKDQLWAAINGKQRRRAGWISGMKVLSTIVLLGLAGAWLLQNQTEASTSSTDQTESVNESKADLSAKASITYNQENDGSSNSKITQQVISEVSVENTDNTIASKVNTKISADKTTVKQSTSTKNNSEISLIKSTTSINQTIKKNQELTTTNNSLDKRQKTNVKQSKTTSDIKLLSETNTATAETSQSVRLQKLNSIQFLSSEGAEKVLTYNRLLPKRNDKVECYDHRKKVPPLYAELYSSVDYVTNRFSAEQEDLNYKEERDASQTQLEGYRAGLRLKFLTRSGLYFKAGVEVSAIRERFDRRETIERTEIRPNQLLETIYKPDSTILIYGNAPVQITENKIWKVWNTYRTVGIPLLVGYQTEVGKFTWGLELGGIYNVHYDFEGMLLNSSLMPVAKPDYFKSRISSSLTGGVNVGYNLTQRMSLMAYASFKHNLSNINQSTNKVQQANTRMGLGLGLQFQL